MHNSQLLPKHKPMSQQWQTVTVGWGKSLNFPSCIAALRVPPVLPIKRIQIEKMTNMFKHSDKVSDICLSEM